MSFAEFAARKPAGALVATIALLAGPGVQAQGDAQTGEHHSHSWILSWIDSWTGLSTGTVSYGSGPGWVIGSDKLIHQPRDVSGVRQIELRGPIDIVLKQADSEKLVVHTDENIAPLIDTSVDGGVLHIGVKPGASFRTRHSIGVTLQVKSLSALKILGSGDVTCVSLDTDLLEITVRGSGDVRFDSLRANAVAVLVQGSGDVQLSGQAAKQGYVIEGSGDVTANELAGREVAVKISGSGDASVWATTALAVEVGGSGDVSYHGNPTVSQSVHGSGSVSHH